MSRDIFMYVPKDTASVISGLQLELVNPMEHLFVHGSRRFGYHLPESETDITIYMNTGDRCQMHDILNLLQDAFDFRSFQMHMSSWETITLRTVQEEYLDDFLPNDEGVAYFHLPLHRLHIRVYNSLRLFNKEKELLELIDKCISDSDISDIIDLRIEGKPYNGKAAIDILKNKYKDKAIARFKDWGGLLFGFFNKKDKSCLK